jgi:hypothetical protein
MSERQGGVSALALIISDWKDDAEHMRGDATNELQMSRHETHYRSKKRRRNSTTSTGVGANKPVRGAGYYLTCSLLRGSSDRGWSNRLG